MWLTGIKSGVITVLGLITYELIVQMMHLKGSLLGNLAYGVLALGIYSGHYYYKAANENLMTYRQGLKLGLIVTSFTGLVNGLISYVNARFVDPTFIQKLIDSIQLALQQSSLDKETIQKAAQIVEAHLTPMLLLIATIIPTLLLGLIFTLVITAFSKRIEK